MNEVVSQFSVTRQEVTLVDGETSIRHTAGVDPASLEELVHEVRQPLGVIESLAYFLEMTATDERAKIHLQRIQAMVLKAHTILEQASRLHSSAVDSIPVYAIRSS